MAWFLYDEAGERAAARPSSVVTLTWRGSFIGETIHKYLKDLEAAVGRSSRLT